MNSQYQRTDRLILKPLELSDSPFIQELVNTKGWLTFIGDRNIKSNADAISYIQKIIDNNKLTYWVVQNSDNTKIGVITLIKREHLPFYDIGFAFLPSFQGKGYAYEASKTVLEYIIDTTDYQAILATTIPGNKSSIKLIEKLGLSYYKTALQNDKEQSLYRLDLDKLRIDRLVKKFFSAFSNTEGSPKLNLLYETCLDQAIIIKNTKGVGEIFDLQSFIAPRKVWLTDGTLQDFEEYEIEEKTTITRHIAQRISQYEKEGVLRDEKFSGEGTKMFQFVKIKGKWKISNVIWDDKDSF